MPKKTVSIEHVYEVSFRIVSGTPFSAAELQERVEAALEARPLGDVCPGAVTCRELCFDRNACTLTEGHRGLHEGPSGGRWGTDL